MKETPLISIIIPTFNGSKTISRAIKSALNQTYPNIGIIVVDDCSKDNTVEVVKSIKDKRLKLIKHKITENGSAARNTGIRESKGEYIAFLDDDDQWLPNKLETQKNYLSSKDINIWKGCVCGHFFLSKNSERQVVLNEEGNLSSDIFLMQVSLAAGSSLIIHKSVIKEIGFFDEKYLRHQDLEYVLRYLRKYKLAVVKEPLVRVYGHSGYVSGDKLVAVKEIFLEDFKKDIEKYGKKMSKKIYARQWLQVSKHYSMDGDIKNTLKYLSKSISYSILFSKKIKFLPLENYIALPYHLLKGILNRNKERGR